MHETCLIIIQDFQVSFVLGFALGMSFHVVCFRSPHNATRFPAIRGTEGRPRPSIQLE